MNDKGERVAFYAYSPFGELTKSEGSYASTNPYTFSSEQRDDSVGLVYYNFRYYSPKLGRWLSKDPIKEKGGYDFYGILGNNVIISNDYLGLTAMEYYPISGSFEELKKWSLNTPTVAIFLNEIDYTTADKMSIEDITKKSNPICGCEYTVYCKIKGFGKLTNPKIRVAAIESASYAAFSTDEKNAWDSFIAYALQHENKHVQIASIYYDVEEEFLASGTSCSQEDATAKCKQELISSYEMWADTHSSMYFNAQATVETILPPKLLSSFL